jgi:hypothetical protein
MAMTPPPGWYADPWQAAPWRWWDGQSWTPHVWPPAPVGVWGGGPPPYTGPSVELQARARNEQRWLGWARAALAVWAVTAFVDAAWYAADSHGLRDEFHRFFLAAGTGLPSLGQPVAAHPPAALGALLGLAGLAFFVTGILFLVWQYNAAKVARWLGYPGRLRPGWGIVGWFVPIANLFMPYWALSDLLPPGHPLRRQALGAWLAYLGTGLLTSVGVGVAAVAGAWAAFPLAIALSCLVTAVTRGWRLLAAVDADHRRALSSRTTLS